MSVVCAACKTENRDNAMFCLGCAGKLPAFAPTAPSALESMKAQPSVDRRRPLPPVLPFEKYSSWMWAGALIIAIALGFSGWYAYVTRKAPSEFVPSSSQGPSSDVGTATGLHRSSDAERQALNPQGVALEASLSPLEAVVDARHGAAPATVDAPADPASVTLGPVPTLSSASAAPTPSTGSTSTLHPERDPIQEPAKSAPTRLAAMNPMRGCEHLNFIFAARCEAINCDKAEFKRHPRCDAVRAERRRDEARRNPTLGY